jgi:hypothetical protein
MATTVRATLLSLVVTEILGRPREIAWPRAVGDSRCWSDVSTDRPRISDALNQKAGDTHLRFLRCGVTGPPLRDLGQVLVGVEVVTEDDTVGGDLVLARERVMGATAGFENRKCAFEPGVSSEELEQDHVV